MEMRRCLVLAAMPASAGRSGTLVILFNEHNDDRRTMNTTLKKIAFVLSLGLGLGVSMSASAEVNETLCQTYANKCAWGIERACQLWEQHCNTEEL